MFDLTHLIQTFSYLGLFIIVFAETGLLIGFFLPGDSLLITAGLLAAEGSLNLWGVVAVCVLAAIIGNIAGYLLGFKVGPLLFSQPKSRLFNPEHVQKTHDYFEKHGPKTIILARFIPIIRTFIATMSGISGMGFEKFALYSVVGGLLWGAGLPIIAYYLGRMIPDLDKYLLLVIGVVILVSFIPVGLEFLKHRKLAKVPNK